MAGCTIVGHSRSFSGFSHHHFCCKFFTLGNKKQPNEGSWWHYKAHHAHVADAKVEEDAKYELENIDEDGASATTCSL